MRRGVVGVSHRDLGGYGEFDNFFVEYNVTVIWSFKIIYLL